MAFVVETGVGLSTANSYASVAEADDYHDMHLFASAWDAAVTLQKETALQMATRLIDTSFEWAGVRSTTEQALGFPRDYIKFDATTYYPDDEVPAGVKNATIELARELLKADRTAESETAGIKSIGLGQGALDMEFDTEAAEKKELFPKLVVSFLRPFGKLIGAASYVPVRRV